MRKGAISNWFRGDILIWAGEFYLKCDIVRVMIPFQLSCLKCPSKASLGVWKPRHLRGVAFMASVIA